jgi:hypothetical protein
MIRREPRIPEGSNPEQENSMFLLPLWLFYVLRAKLFINRKKVSNAERSEVSVASELRGLERQ